MDNTFVVSTIANRIFAIVSICGSSPWKWNWAAGYILDIVVSRKGIPLATKFTVELLTLATVLTSTLSTPCLNKGSHSELT